MNNNNRYQSSLRIFEATWKKALGRQAWDWDLGPIANYFARYPNRIEDRTVLRNIIIRLEAIDLLRRSLTGAKIRLVAWQMEQRLPFDITLDRISVIRTGDSGKRYIQLSVRESMSFAMKSKEYPVTWILDPEAYAHLAINGHVLYDEDDSSEENDAFDSEGEYIGDNGIYKGVLTEPWWDDTMHVIATHYYNECGQMIKLKAGSDKKKAKKLLKETRVHIEFEICEDMRGFRPIRLIKFLYEFRECLGSIYCCPYEYLEDFLLDGLGPELAQMIAAGILPKPHCRHSTAALFLEDTKMETDPTE
jgi:hypothetical protein